MVRQYPCHHASLAALLPAPPGSSGIAMPGGGTPGKACAPAMPAG
eukprot:CAMPEP_0182874086 /NCGR_PEP_ID=MMETSP0034_2-20130328/12724_1 /TAXON_ID=156128 /ORGANISM="Nephroselmis pyriformis, Strain CCMP717" /LENGTH=44 /DNA_ID= /DNA_START= /DNA_END= /DNA_ORIENTATION=